MSSRRRPGLAAKFVAGELDDRQIVYRGVKLPSAAYIIGG
jgi:hypothetical protein